MLARVHICGIISLSIKRTKAVEQKKPKIKDIIETYRDRQRDEKNRNLWKVRILFLAPFLIAAAVFLLMSLD